MTSITIRFEIVEGLTQRRIEHDMTFVINAIRYTGRGGHRRLVSDPETIKWKIENGNQPEEGLDAPHV